MKRLVPVLAVVLFSGVVVQLASGQSFMAEAKERIDSDLKYLASDELEGREPGSKGIELAANYIVDEFKKYGVKSGSGDDTYLQGFKIKMDSAPDLEKSELVLVHDDEEIRFVVGENAQPQMVGGSGAAKDAGIVFVGYGITSDEFNFLEYKDVDVAGKVVVMIRMEPQRNDPNSVFDGTDNSKYAYITEKIAQAKLNKAAAIIMVNDRRTADKEDELALPDEFGRNGNAIPFYHVKRSAINDLLDVTPIVAPDGDKLKSLDDIEERIDETLEPLSQELEGWTASVNSLIADRMVETFNVVGVVEGEGPNADETIVIGGHYDHLGYGGYGSAAPGRREVHNGADDNATGTVGVLELARRFAQSDEKPGRRLVFVAFSGEERGLLGSAHYVNEPLYPLEETVAMVNYDMIGRLRNAKLTIYGTGTAKYFDTACDSANSDDEPISLNKVSSPFAGSDHMAFVRKQIPVMFLHTGLTDIYHTPEDDYETLNVDGTVQVIDYTERLLRDLANADKEKLAFVEIARTSRRRPSYLGVMLDYDGDERGMVVEEVADESPAALAGLEEGDVILSMNGENYTDRNEVIKFLTENRPGTEIDVTYVRDDEETTVKIKLKRTPRRSRRSTDGN